ncbi:MAG: hypothetical protein QNJ09_00865 [Paracoccaceae bacterium]|nr:hypothetical protein [Paracoccaceae bacterium]
MTSSESAKALLENLEDALDLLKDYSVERDGALSVDPLPSLLEQCQAACAEIRAPAPVRTVHHMACTGGSLICKCLAAMPNTTLLSEIYPHSDMGINHRGPSFFCPTDLIYRGRVAVRSVDTQTVQDVFQAGLRAMHESLNAQGRHLVLRDHPHSQFCTDLEADALPTLRQLVEDVLPIRSVVTVRHPLDSFLAMHAHGWIYFYPFTLEEYARRYLQFLKRYEDVPLYRYEEFVADPDAVLTQICADLSLPFAAGYEAMLPVISMTGDSGRRSDRIAARPRREIPNEILSDAAQSASFLDLCQKLGYDPAAS